MKGIQSIIMTLVLLMVAGTAGAQVGETLVNNKSGSKAAYSVSGGKITSVGQVHSVNYVTWQNLSGVATPGTTVRGTFRRISGPDKPDDAGQGRVRVSYEAYDKNGKKVSSEYKHSTSSASVSYTIPNGVAKVTIHLLYWSGGKDGRITCETTWTVSDATPVPTPVVRTPEPEKGPCEKIDSHIRFNDFYGEVKKRCNFEEDDSYEFVDLDDVVYEHDRIKTEEESGAILGLEDMSTYVIKPESIIIIETDTGEQSKIVMLLGSMWTNIKKMAAGKSLDVEMSQCVSGINGTIVAFEETGGKSNIYLFAGSVTVTSKKGTDKVNQQPGQTSSVGSNGKVAVKEFDIEKGAKKFGISMDDIRNHYSNAGTTGNVGLVFTEDKLNYKILSGNTVELTSELKGNYSGHVKIPSVVKHSGVTYQVVGIGKRAFADQTKMKSVEIPASVRSIEEDAFYNTGLASVAVPGNNANVQRHAFRNCRVLTTAIISGKNAYCHPEAFANCNYLQDLRIESPTSTPTTNRSTQTTTTTLQGGVKVSSPGKYSFTLPTNNR
jgi:hypothetical protein